MKKIFACLLSVVLVCGVFAITGCGTKNRVVSNPQTLNIRAWEGGFGLQWLRNLEEGFERKYENEGYEVNIYASTSRDTVTGDFVADMGKQQYDLYFQDVEKVMDYANGEIGYTHGIPEGEKMIVDLAEVYNHAEPGEKKIIEKVNPFIREYYKVDGTYYFVNAGSTAFGFLYNTSFISEEQLPNTTNEFLELCAGLKTSLAGTGKSAVMMFGGKDSYYNDIFHTLWRQYEGAANYNMFFDGQVYEFGEKTHSPEIYHQKGRTEALAVIRELLSFENGYIDTLSSGYGYKEAQINFFEGKAAIMSNGAWLENEMKKLFPDGPEFTMDMMRMPVISSIVKTLEDKSMSDEMLSRIIDEVDAGTEWDESFTLCSKNDFERIKTARKTTYASGTMNTGVIPTTSRNISLAKKFLQYMYSDEGIANYLAAASGAVLPLFEQPELETSVLEAYSNTMKTSLEILYSSDWFAVPHSDFYHKSQMRILGATSQIGTLEVLFGSQNADDRMSVSEIIAYDYDYYTANNGSMWTLCLENAGIKGGAA